MTMDVKGVPWVGAICQKFEALCVEVDEAVYEDTVKYVGNQMRTVGETVKKLYSEVMQDLLISSTMDSPKDKDTVVTVSDNVDFAISAKPETQSVDAESKQIVIESGATTDTTINSESSYSAEEDERCTLDDSQNLSADLLSSNQASSVDKEFNSGQNSELKSASELPNISAYTMKDCCEDSTCSGSWNGWDEAYKCANLICSETSALEESQCKENRERIPGDMMEGYASGVIEGSQAKTNSVSDSVPEFYDSQLSTKAAVESTTTNDVLDSEFNDDISVSDAGGSYVADDVKSEGAYKQRIYISDQGNSFKLGDSCVLVENSELFFKPTREDAQKSYKKKFREVFSRRWSKSKIVEEQLDAWYEEECGKKLVSTSITHGELPKSEASEAIEAEWELL